MIPRRRQGGGIGPAIFGYVITENPIFGLKVMATNLNLGKWMA
jgi:hypothetical protein